MARPNGFDTEHVYVPESLTDTTPPNPYAPFLDANATPSLVQVYVTGEEPVALHSNRSDPIFQDVDITVIDLVMKAIFGFSSQRIEENHPQTNDT